MKNLIVSLVSVLSNAIIKGKSITFTSMESLVEFLIHLDDSKHSFQFGSLIYSRVEDGIGAKVDFEGNEITKENKSTAIKLSGSLFKVAYAPIQTVSSYTKKILNKLEAKGIVMTAENLNVQKSHWAKRHTNSILGYSVKDESKTPKYLAYFPNGKAYNSKFFNAASSSLMSKEQVRKFYTPSKLKKLNGEYGSSTQTNAGLELHEQVTPQILKLENLREVTIDGFRIKYRPENREVV